ncbi:MAG TPA: hypothetical protein ACHBX6_10580 [Arsenophonus nasoniae]|uniref:hypothetical protein n=1 Tax=Arsenophonus nasoniae TaxID=638 RepID=UPI00387A0781
MKSLFKKLTFIAFLGCSFFSLANNTDSSDKSVNTELMCDTQFGKVPAIGSVVKDGKTLLLCPR